MSRNPQLLTAAGAAAYLGVSRQVLRRWVSRGSGPPRRRIGKRYYYVRVLLKEWLEQGAPPAAEFEKPPTETPIFRGLYAAPLSRR